MLAVQSGIVAGPFEHLAEERKTQGDKALLRLLRDPVTNLWNAVYRFAILQETQEWVRKHTVKGWYVELDLRNVGGINAVLGHQVTNIKYFKYAAELLTEILGAAVSAGEIQWYYLFRHGGDEFSLIVVGIEKRSLTAMLDRIVRTVAAKALELGTDIVPHPKNLFRFRSWGMGLAYGVAEIVADVQPTVIFREADTRAEQYKRGMTPGEQYPIKIGWRKWFRMCGILLKYLLTRKLPTIPNL